jgi:hypothetical protein
MDALLQQSETPFGDWHAQSDRLRTITQRGHTSRITPCPLFGGNLNDRPKEIQRYPSVRVMGVVSTRGDRPLRSGRRRGRLLGLRGRNCPGTATGRWRGRESTAAADAVVVPFRPEHAVLPRPLVPVRPVGVLLAVAHSAKATTPVDAHQYAISPLPTWAIVVRQVRLVRSGGSALATTARDTIAAAQPNTAAAKRLSLTFISAPLRCCIHAVSHPPPRSAAIPSQASLVAQGTLPVSVARLAG